MIPVNLRNLRAECDLFFEPSRISAQPVASETARTSVESGLRSECWVIGYFLLGINRQRKGIDSDF